MKSEQEIRERIERLEEHLDDKHGHDLSHLIGLRNGLEWVLESDSGSGSSGDNWTGQTGGQRR
jgi:hypothetical protein